MTKTLKPLSEVSLTGDKLATLEVLREAAVKASGSLNSFFVIERGDKVEALLEKLAKAQVISFGAITGMHQTRVINTETGQEVPDSFAAMLAPGDMEILGIKEAKNLQRPAGRVPGGAE